jgi:hypothetical protein
MKFGKLAPKQHQKTLMMAKYTTEMVRRDVPRKVWREYKVPPSLWGMFDNDEYGDCTCAAIAHMLMLVTSHTGPMVVPTNLDVLNAYSAVSGFDQISGANDNGAAITDVLAYWQSNGIAGHKILGWASVGPSQQTIKQAIWMFGAVNLGVRLPKSAMDQFAGHQPWSVSLHEDNTIEGGHSIPNFGYGSEGTNCITWGQRQGMTWEWFTKFADEAYVVITEDWLDKATQLTPSGFDLATLQADLAALKS